MKLYDVLMGTFHRWDIETRADIDVDDARRLEAALDLWCASIQTGMNFPESWVDQAQSKAEEDANERRESTGLRPEGMPRKESTAATGTRDRIGRVVSSASQSEVVEVGMSAVRNWLANTPPDVASAILEALEPAAPRAIGRVVTAQEEINRLMLEWIKVRDGFSGVEYQAELERITEAVRREFE